MAEFKDEPVTTKFNAAFASLERLHKLLEECNECSRLCHANGYSVEALKMWRFTVVAIYREIRPKLTTGTEGEVQEVLKLFKKFKKINSIIDIKKTEEGQIHQINVIEFNKYWKLISLIETKLRVYADVHGLLIPNSRGALDALE